jgi:lipooligosaccharide transport system permease protein
MASIRWTRIYDAMLATPLRVVDVMRGHLGFLVLRSSLVGALFLASTAAFGVIKSPWALLCIPTLLVLAAACGLPVAAFSATIEQEVWFAVLFRLVVVPLFLFSGTFAPLDRLPGWVSFVAHVTPLWHAVELCRRACAGTLELGPSLVNGAYLLTLAGIGYVLCSRAFKARLAL